MRKYTVIEMSDGWMSCTFTIMMYKQHEINVHDLLIKQSQGQIKCDRKRSQSCDVMQIMPHKRKSKKKVK